LWALFLSPKPVLRTDSFARSLIELLFIAGAVGSLFSRELNWVLVLVFGLVAAALGFVVAAKTH
jgi:hypothetical protein